jgi:glycosyltransferase A (GT-A) superfamily protein (DUF2064 family)
MTNKTAILVFANSAEKEVISKSIQSVDMFDMLNAETLKTVKKTGLPYFHYSEKEQQGKTFAVRFSNAIQSVYDKGFDTVITLGNDTPHLKVSHILKAEQQLKSSDYVLGPSSDGGFYLMGFKKVYFNKDKFETLPWQTSKLQRHFNNALEQQSFSVSYLETLSDLDEISDIDLVLRSFKTLSFKIRKLLLTIRKTLLNGVSIFQVLVNRIVLKRQYNKGSPIITSYIEHKI